VPPTRDTPRAEEKPSSTISVQTLLISSLAAVAAAVVVPMFWERGSLIATAVTPIIVALVSEALNRPAKVIKTTTSQRVARRTATGAAVRSRQPTGVGARGEGPERVTKWGGADDPFGLHREPAGRRRRVPWKLAVLTGLLAAVIGAGAVTASELAIFGHSVGHSDRTTSVFGGSRSETPEPSATAAPTEEATATEEPTVAPTAEATETATPEATVTPTATAPLQATPNATVPPADTATPVPTP
jgi:hypothetical protein